MPTELRYSQRILRSFPPTVYILHEELVKWHTYLVKIEAYGGRLPHWEQCEKNGFKAHSDGRENVIKESVLQSDARQTIWKTL